MTLARGEILTVHVRTEVPVLRVPFIGAVWSSCSPDFGTEAVLDRFTWFRQAAMRYRVLRTHEWSDEVLEELPYREKQLKAALRMRGIGTLTIKKRGVDVVLEMSGVDPAVHQALVRRGFSPNSAFTTTMRVFRSGGLTKEETIDADKAFQELRMQEDKEAGLAPDRATISRNSG